MTQSTDRKTNCALGTMEPPLGGIVPESAGSSLFIIHGSIEEPRRLRKSFMK